MDKDQQVIDQHKVCLLPDLYLRFFFPFLNMASSMVYFSSKDVSHVVKFDGTNFFLKFQMFAAFKQHKLLKNVIGDETKPFW